MEGLIPMVYKTLKRNKARWEYQCLSSSSGTADRCYSSISEFYAESYNYQLTVNKTTSTIEFGGVDPVSANGGRHHSHNRKHKASNVDDYSSGLGRGCKYGRDDQEAGAV
ncbi:uncharacterized protein LOC130759728 [Actinidia eriantha]|uniref:uncharacterized protein LOC130759728 n=1 Tax=Actinidia eriantha TaxID=165200 RepID=UPI00258F609D|nr:uncharacterized protein LOC130759728 [Actinidia eriantha]